MHHKLEAGYLKRLLELNCHFSCACEKLEVLKFCEISHRHDLANWAYQNMPILNRLVINHCEYVAPPKEDSIGNCLASKKEWRSIIRPTGRVVRLLLHREKVLKRGYLMVLLWR